MSGVRELAEAVAEQNRRDGWPVQPKAQGVYDPRFATWMDGSLAALAAPAVTRLVCGFGNLRAVIEGERG